MRFKVLWLLNATSSVVFDADDKNQAIAQVQKWIPDRFEMPCNVDAKWSKHVGREYVVFWANDRTPACSLFVHQPKVTIVPEKQPVENFYKEEDFPWF